MKFRHLAGVVSLFGLATAANAATDYPSGYTKCVQNTGATCTMTGTHTVALGKSGEFVYATKTDSFACTGSAFPTNGFTASAWCSVGPTASASSSSTASSVASSSSSKASSSVASSSASSQSSVASSSVASSVASSISANAKQVEKLDRGVIVVPSSSGVLVTWRQLGTDPSGITFNVYRGSTKVNSSPISATNYQDSSGSTGSGYSVRPIINGAEQTAASALALGSGYLSIPLSRPSGGTTPDGVAYTYEANDGSAADLDGDGQYEIILKWQPTNSKDNSQSGYTGNTFIDAYKLNGTRLWRIDLGKNIRAGAHYTSMVVYDLDGDGKAEVMLKTADGTKDSKGTVIGSSSADYRNSSGYILSGPEYLTVFNGATGAIITTTDYYPARGTVSSWGDSYGNRVDRFLAGVAYVDGKRPSAIFSRGYYTRAVVVAWDYRDGKLSRRWTVDSNDSANSKLAGQGAHYFTVGDVNNDGKDDIIYGAATINGNGSLMYSTSLGHGDAIHMSDLDPNRSGKEVFMAHEDTSAAYGMEMHDAATGKILWGVKTGVDTGRGLCADIDPAYPGYECWSSVGGVYSATGVSITSKRPSINFGIWWDGDLSRELLDGTTISKWSPSSASVSTLVSGANAASNNGTKANPVLSADLFGDWREEVIWRNSDNSALLIYSTGIPTSYKFTTLMHDPQYRAQVAGQNMAYNQPPHPSFFLGNGMGSAPAIPVYTP